MRCTKTEITLTMSIEEAQDLRTYLSLAMRYLDKDIAGDIMTARSYKDELEAQAKYQNQNWINQMQATIDGLESEAKRYQTEEDIISEIRAKIFDAMVD